MKLTYPEMRTAHQMTLGERLRVARQTRNLTQQELAGESYSKSYISAVEHGKMTPSIPALRFLAERLDVPLASLLGEQDIPSNAPQLEDVLVKRLDQAETLLHQGNPTAALEELGPQGDESALRQENPQRWDWLRGWALLQLHQEQEAIALLERGREEAEANQAPCALGHFTFTLATAQAAKQAEEAAEQGFQTALRCAEITDDLDLLSRVEEHYGALLASLGRYRDAYLHQRAAVVASARIHPSH